jgi:adenylyltransferase/sulfurtransferase
MDLINHKRCQLSVEIDPEWELHPRDVHRARQSGQAVLLLDVRHEVEWEISKIPGSTLIPLDALQQRLPELDSWRFKPVVVYCRSGMRSLRAAELLRSAGFTSVMSMAGGIELWAEVIDPAVRGR